MKTVAALAVGAAFPLGAIAAQPAKTMTERGVIETVNRAGKEFALKGGHLKGGDLRVEGLDAVCRKRQAGCSLRAKDGERATVNYALQAKQRVATRIAISPSGKTAQRGVIEKDLHGRKRLGGPNG